MFRFGLKTYYSYIMRLARFLYKSYVTTKLLLLLLFIWMKYSGDTDGRVPVTSTKLSIEAMKLQIKTQWHPWILDEQVIMHIL